MQVLLATALAACEIFYRPIQSKKPQLAPSGYPGVLLQTVWSILTNPRVGVRRNVYAAPVCRLYSCGKQV